MEEPNDEKHSESVVDGVAVASAWPLPSSMIPLTALVQRDTVSVCVEVDQNAFFYFRWIQHRRAILWIDRLIGIRAGLTPSFGLGQGALAEHVSDLLDAVVGNFDTDMSLIHREYCAESFLLASEDSAPERHARDCSSD